MKKILFLIILFIMPFYTVFASEYVTSILVDGEEIFENDKYEYNLNVDTNKESINIIYKYDKDIYNGIGSSGSVSLDYGLNRLTYKITNKETFEEKEYIINITRSDNRSSDNSLKELMIGNNKVILGNDNEYTVDVNSNLTSIEVKASLNNEKAFFVSGYGERLGDNAVKLNGEMTSVEIKVQAENGNIRTYKINIRKKNYKSNDNSLKSLIIDKIDFTFKSDVLEYNLTVPYDTDELVIEALANHDNAFVDYDKKVKLMVGNNVINIKVTAEDSTEKNYVLNIKREEKVSLVSTITIKGIDFSFNPEVYNYKLNTSLEKLEFDVKVNNENTKVDIIGNENLENGSKVSIKVSLNDDVKTYVFKIINEEVVDEKITTSDSNFLEDNEMIISFVILIFGVFMMIVSVVIKSTSKIM